MEIKILKEKSLEELRNMAKELGLNGYTTMPKNELCRKISGTLEKIEEAKIKEADSKIEDLNTNEVKSDLSNLKNHSELNDLLLDLAEETTIKIENEKEKEEILSSSQFIQFDEDNDLISKKQLTKEEEEENKKTRNYIFYSSEQVIDIFISKIENFNEYLQSLNINLERSLVILSKWIKDKTSDGKFSPEQKDEQVNWLIENYKDLFETQIKILENKKPIITREHRNWYQFLILYKIDVKKHIERYPNHKNVNIWKDIEWFINNKQESELKPLK